MSSRHNRLHPGAPCSRLFPVQMQTDHDREMDAVHDRMQLLQEQLTHWVGALAYFFFGRSSSPPTHT